MKIITILGARPQFIKAAPVCFAFRNTGVNEILVHTGQHYDEKMSDIFFREMGIPTPQYNLGVGSGTHGKQTAEMLIRIEEILLTEKPDMLVVYGDTNSTVAGALAACKLHIPIAHIEAGLRSFNKTMPEEHNRIITDHVSSLLFCPVPNAVQQLATEGITKGVHCVGDTMFDAVKHFLPLAEKQTTVLQQYSLSEKKFFLATIHRPYNTDVPERLKLIMEAFAGCGEKVVFPIHPRTRARMQQENIAVPDNVLFLEPLGYLDMLVCQRNAAVIITDSGGVQKEACFVGTPAVTIRSETEWTETVESGWNILAFDSAEQIIHAVTTQRLRTLQPLDAYGKGDAAQHIASIVKNYS